MYHTRYKPFFTIHVLSHQAKPETAHEKPLAPRVPVTQRGKEPKPQSSWITLCKSVNDDIFFSYQQVGKVIVKGVNEHSTPSSHWQIQGISLVYWYETTALCDKEITLPERVRIYLNSKFKISLLSRSEESPRSSPEFRSWHCIPTQLSLQRVILLGHV